MKKLNTFDFVLIPALVALTIVVKLAFAAIPGIEFTTPLFIGLSILLKRYISLYYVGLFLLVDSLLIQQGNIVFIGINAAVWLSIYGLCQLVKGVKWQQPIFVFAVGVMSVLLQTFIWLTLLPIFAPTMATPVSVSVIIGAWIADFVTWHPIVAASFAVTIYFALLGLVQTYRLHSIFDK